MSNNLKRSFVVYTFSNLLSTGLPFLLLPFLTHKLTKADYGVLSNFTGLIGVLIPIVSISFSSAYTRQFYKKDVKIEEYTATGTLVLIFSTVLTSILLFAFESFISSYTGIDEMFLRVISIYCFVFSLSEVVLSMWRIEDKVWHFAGFRIARTLIEVALTLVLILNFNWGYHGRILAIIIATLIGFIPLIWIMYKRNYLKISFKKAHANHLIRYGAPLIPHALGAAMLSYSDKMVITNKIGLDANGVYSVAFQVGLIIGLIQNSFNQAWVPWFFNACSNLKDELKVKIVKFTYLYYLGLVIITGLLILCTPLIFDLLGKEFTAGSELVSWIAIGFLFNGMYKMKVNYLFYMEKTILIGSITIIATILNIVLNISWIDKFGLTGAAMATAATFFFQFVVVWIAAQRMSPMPWFNWKMTKSE